MTRIEEILSRVYESTSYKFIYDGVNYGTPSFIQSAYQFVNHNIRLISGLKVLSKKSENRILVEYKGSKYFVEMVKEGEQPDKGPKYNSKLQYNGDMVCKKFPSYIVDFFNENANKIEALCGANRFRNIFNIKNESYNMDSSYTFLFESKDMRAVLLKELILAGMKSDINVVSSLIHGDETKLKEHLEATTTPTTTSIVVTAKDKSICRINIREASEDSGRGETGIICIAKFVLQEYDVFKEGINVNDWYGRTTESPALSAEIANIIKTSNIKQDKDAFDKARKAAEKAGVQQIANLMLALFQI